MIIEIFLLSLVTAVIFGKLFSILGKKEVEPTRSPTALKDALVERVTDDPQEIDHPCRDVFEEFRKLDPSFRLGIFINGAKHAFELITRSFYSNDHSVLKSLLGKEIYKSFAQNMKGSSAPPEISYFIKCAVEKAVIKGKIGNIRMHFITEQRFVKEDGSTLVEDIEDFWTFQRNLTASNPNWIVVANTKPTE